MPLNFMPYKTTFTVKFYVVTMKALCDSRKKTSNKVDESSPLDDTTLPTDH